MKLVSVAPRSRRLSSWSFPRLRSHPIHFPCAAFQVRRRWSRRNLSPSGAGPWRSFKRAIASAAAPRSSSSPGAVSARGIGPVREQGEAKIAVLTRQIMNLQAFDLLLDLRLSGQKRRHHQIVRSSAGTPS